MQTYCSISAFLNNHTETPFHTMHFSHSLPAASNSSGCSELSPLDCCRLCFQAPAPLDLLEHRGDSVRWELGPVRTALSIPALSFPGHSTIEMAKVS